MVQVVIKFDPTDKMYNIYEPTTSTLLKSTNLTEALINLSTFLINSGMITGDILTCGCVSYHLDFWTMKAMIESNAALMKKLRTAPSGFTLASQRFGGSSSGGSKKDSVASNSGNGCRRGSSKSSGFGGKTGFSAAAKKFGGK